jgi:hypothetical protein
MTNYIVLIFLKLEFPVKPIQKSNGLFKLAANGHGLAM